MDKTIAPHPIEGTLTPPSSKSYAQRAIAAALLSPSRTVLRGMEMCDDTRSALRVAEALGATVEPMDKEGDYAVTGGLDPRAATLDIGESGLSTRLFTPIAALCSTPITITGRGTILSRPMDMMLSPLRALGVAVSDNDGYLPVTVCGPVKGGEVRVDGSVSSQFITGLLMALPLAGGETILRVDNPKSIPYIDMTLDVARAFGVGIEHNGHREFFIPGGQSYQCAQYAVEGDWSGASCLLVAGAIAGGVTLDNLNPLSLQADVAIIEALEDAGARIITTPTSVRVEKAALRAFDFDATHCPDLFPALAALAACCEGVSVIRGTSRLEHKESNRALTLQSELGKMGISVDISQYDIMRITGGQIRGAQIDAHGDHRIAMAAWTLALNASGPVTVHGAECVAKSYPDFWEQVKLLEA